MHISSAVISGVVTVIALIIVWKVYQRWGMFVAFLAIVVLAAIGGTAVAPMRNFVAAGGSFIEAGGAIFSSAGSAIRKAVGK